MIEIRIKEYRMKYNISQKEMASMLGISAAQLSYLENNRRQLTLDMLDKISYILNICPMELVECHQDCSKCNKLFKK